MEKKTVGFIGLGRMGRPMAGHILAAGYKMYVYDVVPDAIRVLVDAGAVAADSPRAVAEHSDIVIAMLPNLNVTETVILGEDGVASGIRPGAVLMDMSTSSPSLSRKIAAEIERRGADFLDCPVSGAIQAANEGDLNVMVGGSADALQRCKDVLAPMAGAIFHLGDVGTGNIGKLLNQMLLTTQIVAGIEVLATAARYDIDLSTLHALVQRGSGNSWAWEHRISRALGSDIPTEVVLDISAKDLQMATTLGREKGVPLFVADAAFQVVQMVKARNTGKEETVPAIASLYEETLKVRFRD